MPKPRVLLLGRCHADASAMRELEAVSKVHILAPVDQGDVSSAIARIVGEEGPFLAVVVGVQYASR